MFASDYLIYDLFKLFHDLKIWCPPPLAEVDMETGDNSQENLFWGIVFDQLKWCVHNTKDKADYSAVLNNPDSTLWEMMKINILGEKYL